RDSADAIEAARHGRERGHGAAQEVEQTTDERKAGGTRRVGDTRTRRERGHGSAQEVEQTTDERKAGGTRRMADRRRQRAGGPRDGIQNTQLTPPNTGICKDLYH